MKLCGQISVELNVGDYVEAADHQKRLEEMRLPLARVTKANNAVTGFRRVKGRRARSPASAGAAARGPPLQ